MNKQNVTQTKKAKELINWNRWDILAKLYYAYIYLVYQKSPPKWAVQLYSDHIMVLNGAKEELTYYQKDSKENIDSFINSFNDLIDNISRNGYNSKYPIPITINGSILNGGHRLAISANLGLNIPIEKINKKVELDFTSFCFQDRKKNESKMPKIESKYYNDVKNSLPLWENDAIALNMLVNNSENYRIIIFFDPDRFETHKTEIKSFLTKNKTNIVYLKELNFSRTGIYKLVQHLYYLEKHVNINHKTNQVFQINPKKNNYKCTIGILHSTDLNMIGNLSKSGGSLKTQLRKLLGNHHQLHISDNINDTIISGRLLLHQPSINFVNIAPVNIMNNTNSQLKVYHNYLKNLYKLQMKQLENSKINETKNQIISQQNYYQFQDMFCLVSGFILTLHNLRKSNDIDFISNTKFIIPELHHLIDKISHNKYESLYNSNLNEMIYNPKCHFYYMGHKCLIMDEVLKMKKNRHEKPKDINDIQLIHSFNKYAYLKHMVTIITATHVLPSAPSTHIIESMLTSLHKYVEGSQYMNHLIFVDSQKTSINKEEYILNLNKLRVKYPNLYIIHIPESGLKANYINGIKLTTTPYLYFIEHDWIFLEQIPTSLFVNAMNKHTNIHYIKMSKRSNMEKGGWDKYLIQDKNYDTLVKTNSWTNHPHIVRRSKWTNDWLNVINPNKKMDKSFGIEEVLYKQYQHDIDANGFKKAHQHWGCYNWLTNSGKSCIKHLDGSHHYQPGTLDGI